MTQPRRRLSVKARRAYVEGMKRYQDQGIRILIDGKEPDDALWDQIFEIRRDGMFYMADYIFSDGEPGTGSCGGLPEPEPESGETAGAVGRVAEEQPKYGARRRLKEIHFERVYNR